MRSAQRKRRSSLPGNSCREDDEEEEQDLARLMPRHAKLVRELDEVKQVSPGALADAASVQGSLFSATYMRRRKVKDSGAEKGVASKCASSTRWLGGGGKYSVLQEIENFMDKKGERGKGQRRVRSRGSATKARRGSAGKTAFHICLEDEVDAEEIAGWDKENLVEEEGSASGQFCFEGLSYGGGGGGQAAAPVSLPAAEANAGPEEGDMEIVEEVRAPQVLFAEGTVESKTGKEDVVLQEDVVLEEASTPRVLFPVSPILQAEDEGGEADLMKEMMELSELLDKEVLDACSSDVESVAGTCRFAEGLEAERVEEELKSATPCTPNVLRREDGGSEPDDASGRSRDTRVEQGEAKGRIEEQPGANSDPEEIGFKTPDTRDVVQTLDEVEKRTSCVGGSKGSSVPDSLRRLQEMQMENVEDVGDAATSENFIDGSSEPAPEATGSVKVKSGEAGCEEIGVGGDLSADAAHLKDQESVDLLGDVMQTQGQSSEQHETESGRPPESARDLGEPLDDYGDDATRGSGQAVDTQVDGLGDTNQSTEQSHGHTDAELCKGKSKRKRQTQAANSKRKSLAGAGTVWKDGLRRSTRIRSRPLEYWNGERMLYGRVHDTLVTLIGIKTYTSPPPTRGRDKLLKFNVQSFVSPSHQAVVDFAAI